MPDTNYTMPELSSVSALGATDLFYVSQAGASKKCTAAQLVSFASVPTAANPTASVGLTAVNGSAGTFLRSDGAPALDVGIAPTWTGRHVFSINGAVSAPPVSITGDLFTGGSSTTTKPQVLIEPTGTTSTGWSTSGTMLGANAPSGFTGRLFDGQINGASKFSVSAIGMQIVATATTDVIATLNTIASQTGDCIRVQHPDNNGGTYRAFTVKALNGFEWAYITNSGAAYFNSSVTCINITVGGGCAIDSTHFYCGSGGVVQWGSSQYGNDVILSRASAGVLALTGAITVSANGAASTPAETLTGTWFTGGSSTTTKPQVLIEPTGTTSTGWSTSGTGIGVNAPSGFAGNLLDLQIAGTSSVKFSGTGGGEMNIVGARYGTAVAFGIPTIISYIGGQIAVGNSGLWLGTQLCQWGGNAFGGDTALGRNAAGIVEINNGTPGTFAALVCAGITNSKNGAASTPAETLTGTWFTGGSSTTTKPQVLIEPTGTTSTGWSTSGTGIGVNAASGFAGNLADFQVAGVSKLAIGPTGQILCPDGSNATLAITRASNPVNRTGFYFGASYRTNFVNNQTDSAYIDPSYGFRSSIGGSNGGVGADSGGYFSLCSAGLVAWSSDASNSAQTKDTGLSRNAAGVVEVNSGTAGTKRWLQDAGRTRLTADATNATATMSNLTDLSVTLIAGRKYTGELVLFASTDVTTDGLAIDFDGGTATMTSFRAGVGGTPIGATVGVTESAALATDLTFSDIGATGGVEVFRFPISMVVNAAGTFIPRFSQKTHTTGTATIKLGSFLHLLDSVN